MSALANPLPVSATAELTNTLPMPEGPNMMEMFTVSLYPYLFMAGAIVVALFFAITLFRGWSERLVFSFFAFGAATCALLILTQNEQQELNAAAVEDGYGVTILSGADEVPISAGGSGSVLLQVDGQVRECVITATEQGSFLVRCAADGARMEVLVPQ